MEPTSDDQGHQGRGNDQGRSKHLHRAGAIDLKPGATASVEGAKKDVTLANIHD